MIGKDMFSFKIYPSSFLRSANTLFTLASNETYSVDIKLYPSFTNKGFDGLMDSTGAVTGNIEDAAMLVGFMSGGSM